MAKRSTERTGTEWGMLASGEGANRIAIQYLAEFQNKYMSDRILLFNTTKADVRPEKFGAHLTPEFQAILQKIKKEKTCIFGSAPSGAGNVWKIGEDEAAKDFETIRRYVSNSQLAQVDVMLGVTTLGGGTGNGSLPYIINQLKSKMPTTAHGRYISLAIWPLSSEASQRHFNAICGFTRLLKYGEKGRRNSDMVIVIHNSQVAKMIGKSTDKLDKFYKINYEIIKAVDMMIAPSGRTSEATIDIADYYEIPTSFGVYHFTPAISWDNDPDVIGIEAGIELAMRSPMCPIQDKTATMAYFIVRAPEKIIKAGVFSQEEIEEAARKVSSRFIAGKHGGLLRYCSLSSKSAGDGYDVMVLLGGFSLKKLLSDSIGKFKAFADNLKPGMQEGTVELKDDEHPHIKTKLKADELERIEEWLREYSKKTEDLIQRTRRGDLDEEKILDDWMQPGKVKKEKEEKKGKKRGGMHAT
ncbi:MAG: hypothetical protein ABIG39_00515 [Candidatus Micrarchaeota archaeon]